MHEFTREQKIIILTNRLSFSNTDIKELSVLSEYDIDWYQVLRYAAKNKIISLVYYNLNKLGVVIPKPLRQIFKYYYLGTVERNKLILTEYERLREVFANNNIQMAPVKGVYLLPNMYKDLGIRTLNDIDCLIRHKDTVLVKETLNSLGYKNGDYDSNTNTIVSINSRKSILWKMKMNSLYPFRKIEESPFLHIVDIDFSFGLDLKREIEPVNEMMNIGEVVRQGEIILKPAHFFIHQCCHHYKEASNAAWILKGSDFNLIKFCDVREFILGFMNSSDLDEAVLFANKYGFAEAVYFILFYLQEIYHDGYEETYLNKLKCNNEFLHFFGERDFGSKVQWKKNFWERIFADNNKDELIDQARFLRLYPEE